MLIECLLPRILYKANARTQNSTKGSKFHINGFRHKKITELMCKDISDQDVDLAYHLQQSAYVSPYQATSPPGQTHLTR